VYFGDVHVTFFGDIRRVKSTNKRRLFMEVKGIYRDLVVVGLSLLLSWLVSRDWGDGVVRRDFGLDSLRVEVSVMRAAFDARIGLLDSLVVVEAGRRRILESRLGSLVMEDPMEWLLGLSEADRSRVVSYLGSKVMEEL
jgi:hypothetical protein